MARDGFGTFNLPAGQPVVTGTVIDSTIFNALTAELAAALTASIAKDGQTTPTGNLPMGGFKHTGVGDGSTRTHYASVGQLQDGTIWQASLVTGTNTITASLTPAISSYAAGLTIGLIPANSITAAATLALNGLTAKSIVKYDNQALVANDLRAGYPAYLVYNGTSFFLLNPLSYAFPSAVTIQGGTAWHSGNDGAASGLDADLLDGQQGSFYQDAGNLNAGTLANARVAQSNVTQHQSAINSGVSIAASQVSSGTFADARVAQTNVTQHQSAINSGVSIAASQVSSGTFSDARVAQSNVTQHQAAMTTRNISSKSGVSKTLQSGGSPSGGSDGDIFYIY